MAEYELHLGDCLDVMPTLADQSVDCVLADPPYGVTQCRWDAVIPFEPMWAQLKRLIKPRGAIVLFGSQPFTSALVMSNVEWFKYEWVWNKRITGNPFLARYQPLKITESVSVFSREGHNYNPQMKTGVFRQKGGGYSALWDVVHGTSHNAEYYPVNLLDFSNSTRAMFHPTQKPVALLRYLIRTYTNEGDTVLDFTQGSGSTGVAAMLEKRRYVGVELDEGYHAIAEKRIREAAQQAAGEFMTIEDDATHDDLPLFGGAP